MKKFLIFLLWNVIFFGVGVAFDQVILRVDADVPGYREGRNFYLDFRARLLGLRPQSPTIEDIIEKAPPAPSPSPGKTGFLYVDGSGALHMADSLEEIPPEYRREAKRLNP